MVCSMILKRKKREETGRIDCSSLWRAEDWWACWCGFLLFFLCFNGLISVVPKPQAWTLNPLSAISANMVLPLICLMLGLIVMYSIGIKLMRGDPIAFAPAFVALFLLVVFSQILAKQETIRSYGLEYALWALVFGMIISNTRGHPSGLNQRLKQSSILRLV